MPLIKDYKSYRARPPTVRVITGLAFLLFTKADRAMSWFSSGKTNDELVNNLKGILRSTKVVLKADPSWFCIVVGNRIIKSDKVERVMKAVDRADFAKKGNPYQDSPQGIGYGVTISAPHMVSFTFIQAILLVKSIKCVSVRLTACLRPGIARRSIEGGKPRP